MADSLTEDPSTQAQSTQPMAKSDRLTALDVMRGLTILAMIMVNNPGSWDALYPPVEHAYWHGWTPTDLVFPFFLFMVGVSMAYSFRKYTSEEQPAGDQPVDRSVYLRVFRRVLALILIGLVLNGAKPIIGALLGYSTDLHLDTLRWPGVLQRIGLAYLGASLIVLWLGRRWQIAMVVILQLTYWALLVNLPTDIPVAERLEETSNIVREFDQAVIGEPHLWYQRPTDPEGLLSTLTSIVSVLFGYRVGKAISERVASGMKTEISSCLKLLFYGSLLAGAGWFFSGPNFTGFHMPINKPLWTPTFVLFTSGLAFITLAVCLYLFDVVGRDSKTLQKIGTAFEMVGVNAIFAYAASTLGSRIMSVVKVGDVSLKEWIYQNVYIAPLQGIGFSDPRLGSLAFAICYVAIWWLILWGMWRKGWSIRV